jgi:hypothetical protein
MSITFNLHVASVTLQDKQQLTQRKCTAENHAPNILPVSSNIFPSIEGRRGHLIPSL